MPFLRGNRFPLTRTTGVSSLTFDFYDNSARPDDTGDGLTRLTAKKTLAAARALLSANKSLGEVVGSSWAETFLIPAGGITIRADGPGAPPVHDGAGPVLETWVRHDAGTYPNVWSVNPVHGWTYANSRMMMWKNIALLKRVSSIAAVQAEAGTYYSPGDNIWSASSYPLYMNAAADPNADGALYERTQRQDVLSGAYSGYDDVTVRGIITGRQGSNDGSIVLGKNSLIDRVMAFDGHKHNALQESGLCRDSVFFNSQPETNYLHVFYTPDGTGLAARMENCFFVGQSNGLRGSAGVYAHDNSGSAHATHTLVGVGFKNMGTSISSLAVDLSVDGAYIENGAAPFGDIYSNTSDLSHLLVNKQYGRGSYGSTGTHRVRQSAFYLLSNTQLMQLSNPSGFGTISVEDSTIHLGEWDTTITNYGRVLFNRTTGTGTCSAQRCILLAVETDTTLAGVVTLNTASLGTFNNNVYYFNTNTPGSFNKSHFRWNVDGVNLTFAQWQALGKDLNSVVLDATDIALSDLLMGDPADGDFRIKSSVNLTLPDGTPIKTLGVQEHYDFASRSVKAGAPGSWISTPDTYAKGSQYIQAPSSWDYAQAA